MKGDGIQEVNELPLATKDLWKPFMEKYLIFDVVVAKGYSKVPPSICWLVHLGVVTDARWASR